MAFAFLAVPAGAGAAPSRSWVPAGLDEQQSSEHFLVHYTTRADDPNVTTDPSTIPPMLELAERAYADYGQRLGLVPRDDGDGKIDIYLANPSADRESINGITRPDTSRASTTSAILLRPAAVPKTAVIHELAHVMQLAIYRKEAHWLKESTAEWIRYSLLGQAARLGHFDRPYVPLDCEAPISSDDCGKDGYGYNRWVFWQTVSEQYGPTVVKSVFDHAAALGASDPVPHTLAAIDAALAPYGSDVVDTLFDTVEFMIGGAFTLPGLTGRLPGSAALVTTAGVSQALPAQTIPVDHLAARYVRFASTGPKANCRPATLNVTVTLPAGVATRPVWARRGMRGEPLAIDGSTASVAIPWRSCTGASIRIGLPNGERSATADDAPFTVRSSVTLEGDKPPEPTTQPPDKVTQPPPAPVLRAPYTRARLRLKRTGKTRLVVVVRSNRPGQLLVTNSAVRRNFTRPDWWATVPPAQRGPASIRRLHAGLNRFFVRLPKGYKHKRDFIVLVPFATAGGQTSVGATTVLQVRYLQPKS